MLPKVEFKAIPKDAELAPARIDRLVEAMANPADFFNELKRLPEPVQFHVVRTLARTANQTDERYAVSDENYKIFFHKNGLALTPGESNKYKGIESGLEVQGKNLIAADPMNLPLLPAGYSSEMIEDKLLGKPREGENPPKFRIVSNFVMAALLYPQMRRSNYSNNEIVKNIQLIMKSKNLKSTEGEPPLDVIIAGGMADIKETQWRRLVR